MAQKAIPIIWLTVSALLGGGISYLVLDHTAESAPEQRQRTADAAKPAAICPYTTAWVRGYQHIRPLLSSEPICESARFEGLRTAIGAIVDGLKASGQVTSTSVYVRDFKNAEWTWYNGDEPYDPGSMLKVPLLLTYLAMAEEDPALLERTWTCERVDFEAPQHTAFPAPQVELNKSYTLRQIFEYMMVHSDNRATVMLLRRVPKGRYLSTFTDLGLPTPDWDAPTYRLNVRDYSVFMKALYNSSLLSPVNSEYALELMTRATFKQGLVAGLPAEVEVAHKFGEAGTPQERQLHETGLVYMEGYPYLITVMTRGDHVDSLADAIASISHLVFTHMRPA